MDPLWFFLVMIRASCLSLGGQTGVPLLRDDLVLTGVMTDVQLIQALTIGRLGTGPGGLYIVAIGYIVMGPAGAALALLAAVIPPLLVLPLSGYLRPRLPLPRVNGLLRGLVLASSGLVVAMSVELLSAGSGTSGIAGWQVALVGAGLLAGLTKRIHPIAIIGVAAIAGILLGP